MTSSPTRWTSVLLTHSVLIGWKSVPRLVTSKTLYRASVKSSEVIEKMERETGLEPACPAWEAGILPLNYSRLPYFSSTYLFSKDLGRSTTSLFRLLRLSKTMGFDRKMDSKVDSKPVWEAFASDLLVYCPLL